MKLSLLQKTALPLSVAFVALASAQANAAILSTTGDIFQVTPPPGTSLAEGGVQSNRFIYAFDEKQGQLISAPNAFGVDVRNIIPGTTIENQGGFVNLSPGTLTSGNINSHLLHFDPRQNQIGPPLTLSGMITFTEDIVAIITETQSLDGSDFLGLNDVIYPPVTPPGTPPKDPDNTRRGLGWGLVDEEFGVDEGITILNSTTLSIDLTALKAIDQIRVITGTAVIVPSEPISVPEPTSVLGLLALGAIGAGSQLLSKKKQK